jgi:alkylhydroperoxidase/carboxymuconolactone decarboxylase family protein YurZ
MGRKTRLESQQKFPFQEKLMLFGMLQPHSETYFKKIDERTRSLGVIYLLMFDIDSPSTSVLLGLLAVGLFRAFGFP